MTITIDVPQVHIYKYREMFERLVNNYSIKDISKIEEELFYNKMLNWVFQEENDWVVKKIWKKISLKNLV